MLTLDAANGDNARPSNDRFLCYQLDRVTGLRHTYLFISDKLWLIEKKYVGCSKKQHNDHIRRIFEVFSSMLLLENAGKIVINL